MDYTSSRPRCVETRAKRLATLVDTCERGERVASLSSNPRPAERAGT